MMTEIRMGPLPVFYREHAIRIALWHKPQPVFDGPSSAAARERARAMFQLLDRPSQHWYAYNCRDLFGDLVDEFPEPHWYGRSDVARWDEDA